MKVPEMMTPAGVTAQMAIVEITVKVSPYSTVGRSRANKYDLRRHIYPGAKCQGKYAAEVVYSGYNYTDLPY